MNLLKLFSTIFALANLMNFSAFACPGGDLNLFKDEDNVAATLKKVSHSLEISPGYELISLNVCRVDSSRPSTTENPAVFNLTCYYEGQQNLEFLVATKAEPQKLLRYKISFFEMQAIYRGCAKEIEPVE